MWVKTASKKLGLKSPTKIERKKQRGSQDLQGTSRALIYIAAKKHKWAGDIYNLLDSSACLTRQGAASLNKLDLNVSPVLS